MSCAGCARRRAKLKAAAEKARNALRSNLHLVGGSSAHADIPRHKATEKKEGAK